MKQNKYIGQFGENEKLIDEANKLGELIQTLTVFVDNQDEYLRNITDRQDGFYYQKKTQVEKARKLLREVTK
jgi:hypothetical protein